MKISGKVFTEKKEAGVALLAVCKDIKSVDAAMDIGSYQGFNMRIQFDSWSKEFILSVKHESVAKVRLGADALGNITRINNLLESLESYPEKMAEAEQRLETVQEQMTNAKEEVGKPFPKEIESHGMQIKKEDYKLVYVGELLGNMSLDDIFERFNIDRPKDFRGHSLSVSDIVVLNDGEKVTAHFVDSISFEQLDSFLNLEEQIFSELAYEVGERYFAIQRTEEGYDYSFYDEDFRLMDGGVYENDEISIEEAAEELLEDEG